MRDWDFELLTSEVTEDDANRLIERGCDDGVSTVRHGVPILKFSREAESLPLAVATAIRDTESSGITVYRVQFWDQSTDATLEAVNAMLSVKTPAGA